MLWRTLGSRVVPVDQFAKQANIINVDVAFPSWGSKRADNQTQLETRRTKMSCFLNLFILTLNLSFGITSVEIS